MKTSCGQKLSLEEWKTACSKYLLDSLSLADLWDEEDPYDIAECWPDAFEKGQSPEEFVREVFEEDLAQQQYNDYLADEALKATQAEEEEE